MPMRWSAITEVMGSSTRVTSTVGSARETWAALAPLEAQTVAAIAMVTPKPPTTPLPTSLRHPVNRGSRPARVIVRRRVAKVPGDVVLGGQFKRCSTSKRSSA